MNWKLFWKLWKVIYGHSVLYYDGISKKTGFQVGIRAPWFLVEYCFRVAQQGIDTAAHNLTGVKVCWGHWEGWNVPHGESWYKNERHFFASWEDTASRYIPRSTN